MKVDSWPAHSSAMPNARGASPELSVRSITSCASCSVSTVMPAMSVCVCGVIMFV